MHAINLSIERDVIERSDDLFATQAAAVQSWAARIISQSITLNEQRILHFDLLGRAIMGVAVIDRYCRGNAVFGLFGAPTPTK